jgi:YHS domain-containing protein
LRTAFALALLFVSVAASAQQPAHDPEHCLGAAGSTITAAHDGKTYRFRTEACRDEFLSDPERFAQLYDALAELRAAGVPSKRPGGESLVPS